MRVAGIDVGKANLDLAMDGESGGTSALSPVPSP